MTRVQKTAAAAETNQSRILWVFHFAKRKRNQLKSSRDILCLSITMRFEDILIKNVRMHPWLYDKDSKLYHSKSAKAEAWAKIVAATGISEKDCQSRWRTLRDAFVRHHKLHEMRQLHEGKSVMKWPFYNALRFLKPFVRTHKKTYAFQHTSDDDDAEGEETTEAPTETKRTKLDDDKCESPRLSAMLKQEFSSPDTDNNRDEDDGGEDVDADDFFNASSQNYCEFNKTKSKRKDDIKRESSTQSITVEPEQFTCMQIPAANADESSCDGADDNENDDATQSTARRSQTRLKKRQASGGKANANARMYNKLEIALQTIGDYVTHKTSKEDEKSSNAAFLSMLDEYLMQLADDRRENMKMKILNSVYNKIRESQ